MELPLSFRDGSPDAAESARRPGEVQAGAPGTSARRSRQRSPRSSSGRDIYDVLALLVFAALAVLVISTFRDYGISTDEYVQQVYGERLWSFYLSGFSDRSAFHFDNLYLYGGLFDMVAVALQHVLPIDAYHVRHLLCGLIGTLGVVGARQLGKQVGGSRVGFLVAAMLALSGSWYGAIFNNTKDIPFAVGMTWMLYLTCRMLGDLPRPRLHDVLWFGIVAGATLGLRFGGVLAFLYLGIVVLVYLVSIGRRSGLRTASQQGAQIAVTMLPALPIAYAVMGFFWPWSMQSPLNPLRALVQLTAWPFRTELNGTFYLADNLPWIYLPSYLAIKTPEVVLCGLLLLVGFAVAAAIRGRSTATTSQRLSLLAVIAAVVVPMLYVLIARPAFYNGVRHFFFVLPPLYVLAALGVDRLWRETERCRGWVTACLIALLAGAAAREVVTMIELHPNEYVYFNELVGGTGGAYRKYELDYWSNFVPEALQQLERRLSSEQRGTTTQRRYTVGLCTREETFAKYAPPFLTATKDWKKADFIITTTNGNCDRFATGRTIIEVVREGAVLGVVKDRRPGMTAQGATTAPPIR